MRYDLRTLAIVVMMACIAAAIWRWLEPSPVLRLERKGWKIQNRNGCFTISDRVLAEDAEAQRHLRFDEIWCLGEIHGLCVVADWFTIDEFRKFEQLRACQYLRLDGDLTEEHFEVVARMTALQDLRLPRQTISRSSMTRLSALPNLRRLSVRGAAIAHDAFSVLGKMQTVEWLELSSKHGVTPSDIAQLRNLPHLTRVSLLLSEGGSSNQESQLLGEVAKISSLQVLVIGGDLDDVAYERLMSVRPDLKIELGREMPRWWEGEL
jgi:hypothetical protein